MVKIKITKKFGRGVYSTQLIKKGQLLFVDQLLIIDRNESNILQNTILKFYVYGLNEKSAISLGNGSLFNHDKKPNVKAIIDTKNNTISFYAIKDIAQNEQCFLNYGYDF